MAVFGAALWWRKHPTACPYRQRFWIEAPHPLITRNRLRDVLEPRPGEHLLEVGPGTGYYTLDVADWTSPGQLDIFDLQQEMLDHTMRCAAARGLTNITPMQGDAQALPYPDETFDAAYLTTVLGEIPDQDAALRELARADAAFEIVRQGCSAVPGPASSPSGATTCVRRPLSCAPAATAVAQAAAAANAEDRTAQLAKRRGPISPPLAPGGRGCEDRLRECDPDATNRSPFACDAQAADRSNCGQIEAARGREHRSGGWQATRLLRVGRS